MEVSLTLKEVWKHMRCKWLKEHKENKNPMPWNIYATGVSRSKYLQKFNIIRKLLKYSFIMPGLYLIKKLFNKVLEKEVKETPYNINLKIFEKAFDDAVEIWLQEYVAREKSPSETVDGTTYLKWKNGYAVDALNVMKRLVLTMAINDTCYREFLNILVFNIANGVIAEYKDCEHVKHILFGKRDTYDIIYLTASQIVKVERDGEIEEFIRRRREGKLEEEEKKNDTV